MAVVTVDFDGTLYQGNSFNVMFQAGQKEFTYKEWTTVYRHLAMALALGVTKGKNAFRHQFFKGFAKTFKGKSETELDLFFEKLVDLGKEDVHYGLVEHVRKHQQKGDHVVILSGALRPFLKAFVKKIGLDVDIIGTELEYYPNGICTGEIGTIVNGDEKVRKVREWMFHKKRQGLLTDDTVWAYADSKSDLPLFEFAHYPVVVNPKSDIEKVAQQKEWPIIA